MQLQLSTRRCSKHWRVRRARGRKLRNTAYRRCLIAKSRRSGSDGATEPRNCRTTRLRRASHRVQPAFHPRGGFKQSQTWWGLRIPFAGLRMYPVYRPRERGGRVRRRNEPPGKRRDRNAIVVYISPIGRLTISTFEIFETATHIDRLVRVGLRTRLRGRYWNLRRRPRAV